ncbi:hypothetical protein Fcan01_24694, partial [Folsomia candida]
IAWLALTLALFVSGVQWSVQLYGKLTENPTVLVFDETTLPVDRVTYPEIQIYKRSNFIATKIEELKILHYDAALGSAKDSDDIEWQKEETTALLYTVNHICNPLDPEIIWNNESESSNAKKHYSQPSAC